MADSDIKTDLEQIATASEELQRNLGTLLDVSLQVSVELGNTRAPITDILKFDTGAIVELEKLAGEALDIRLNGKLIARGEAVVVDGKLGVRVLEMLDKQAIISNLGTAQS